MSEIKKSKYLRLGGRVALSAVILVYLLSKIDFTLLGDGLIRIRYMYLLISLVPFFVEIVLKAYKWQMLLELKDIDVPFLKIFKIYYISSFLGIFLPSSLGIDLLRSYSLSKHTQNTRDSISTVFVDRLLGIMSLVFVVTVGLLLVKTSYASSSLRLVLVACLILLAMFIFLLLFRYVMRALESMLIKLNITGKTVEKTIEMLHAIYTSIVGFRKHKMDVLKVFLVSIVFQLNRIVITYILSLSLDIDIELGYWLIIVPLVTLISMLPLSIAGLGVREGAFMYFLGQFGVDLATAFLLSFIAFILGIVVALPALFLYLKSGLSMEEAPHPP